VTKTSDFILISHPNVAFAGARNLYTGRDGHLLAITRKPLFDACARLLEEKLCDADTMVCIIDNYDAVPPICGRVSDVLGIARLAVA
jgi:hypothetical protein